ncbi:murein hydrolase activator EnvC family protein [Vallitalea okinawensis]|uniref:murein hydrolase activator EnvC family protein n=1 Tax=Vallitalea okinawensis TaxID=2078660 RepID=UPI000CFD714D|nr:M23 family metallopeptidase [Vallitalea okinawensis]
MRFKRVVTLLLICAVILSNQSLLRASSLDQLTSQKSNQQKEIEAYNAELKQLESDEAVVVAEINELSIEIEVLESDIDVLGQQIDEKEQDIQETEANLVVAKGEEEAQYEATKSNIKYMYEHSRESYIQMLLEADSISDFYKRFEYIKAMMDYDKKLFKDLEETRIAIEEMKASLENDKADLLAYNDELNLQMEDLNQSRVLKTSRMKDLQAKQVQVEDKKEMMEDSIAETEKLIKAEEARLAAMKYSGGEMAWPVPGYYRLSSPYGWRKDPFTGEDWYHYGIDIPAPAGTPVVAAASGEVIHSGWINGYGYTIMIAHGSGIVTLYGHNSSLVVSKGDQVSRGDTIAKIGSTGRSTGNHSHFEVRVNGEFKDPQTYVTSD